MRRIVLSIIIVISSFVVKSQSSEPIVVNAKETPLSTVLLELRDNHQFKFAYNEQVVSQYKVSLTDTFYIQTNVIKALVDQTPLKFEQSGEVFIIFSQEPEKKKLPKISVKGVIVDAFTKEPLPYSHVQVNNHAIVSDLKGSFTYTSQNDSVILLRATHLGYFIQDTLIHQSGFCQFNLIPASEKLSEIFVVDNPIQKATLIGDDAGKMKINHKISRFMPGNGDNSVYNMLRVMPGIMAAGEQTTDLLIWGGYAGQSQITYDGFSIFGLKNYNDNIGVVNPLAVKNIEIHKGGYEAKYGNRIGGIVEIIGKNGSIQKPTLSFSMSNSAINGVIEIPIFNKRSSLLLAHRRTYYNLYNSDDFNIYAPIRKSGDLTVEPISDLDTDLTVYPKNYSFYDTNLKYTYRFKNGNLFYVSLYDGRDNFELVVENEREIVRKQRMRVYNEQTGKYQWKRVENYYQGIQKLSDIEGNLQQGGSVYYDVNWRNGYNSNFILSASKLENNSRRSSGSFVPSIDSIADLKDRNWKENSVDEFSFRNENTIYFDEGHQMQFGAGFYQHHSTYSYEQAVLDSTGKDTISQGYDMQSNRIYAFVQENLPIGEKLTLKGGLRINYLPETSKIFWEPRLSLQFSFEPIKLNLSWGKYNQFIYKTEYVDGLGNYIYYWSTNSQYFPVLESDHFVGGTSYYKNDFTANIDVYYKLTDGMRRGRFTPSLASNNTKYYDIDAKSYGVDFYLKKEFDRLAIWGSYSWSKALEKETRITAPDEEVDYVAAPQDQRHEAKLAAIYQLGSFYFSANYIYGSGLQIIKETLSEPLDDVKYNRFDAALLYKFNPGSIKAEVGLSVLNVFNSQNFKYSNIQRVRITAAQQLLIYANAVPFTPAIHLKLMW